MNSFFPGTIKDWNSLALGLGRSDFDIFICTVRTCSGTDFIYLIT